MKVNAAGEIVIQTMADLDSAIADLGPYPTDREKEDLIGRMAIETESLTNEAIRRLVPEYEIIDLH